MSTRRSILLFTLIAAFFVTAPLVTLYTAGYRYHWKKHRIERVGYLEIGTIPDRADVRIDGEFVGTTPFVNTNALPGDYKITVEKSGYFPYEKQIAVRSGLSTLIRNILLWKNSAPILLDGEKAQVSIAPDGRHVAWIGHADKKRAAFIGFPGGDSKTLNCNIPETGDIEMTWNSDGTAVLLTGTQEKTKSACVGTVNGVSTELESKLNANLIAVAWSPFDKSHLLVQTARDIRVVAWERMEEKKILDKSVPFAVRGSRFYTIESDASGTRLVARALSSRTIENQVNIPAGSYTFLATPDKFLATQEMTQRRIDVYDPHTLARQTSLIADRIIFEPKNKPARFLAVSGFELSLHNLEDNTSFLVTRLSQPMGSVLWHPMLRHAILFANGNITAIEVKGGEHENISLASFENVSDLWITKDGNELLIAGKREESEGIWKLEVKE